MTKVFTAIIKLIGIIIIIILLLLVVAIVIFQVPRFIKLRREETLFELDEQWAREKRINKGGIGPIIITMSTIPERIELLGPTIASLLDQTLQPSVIQINIPMISRKGKTYKIPDWLSKLNSVKINRVEKDIGPGTKIIPTLKQHKTRKDSIIIAVDDDNIYNRHTLEKLVETHLRYKNDPHNPEAVCVSNYGIILQSDGKLCPMIDRFKYFFQPEREVDLLQGFSAFLVTPEMFRDEVYDIEKGPAEAISVDDIWLSGWLKKKGHKIISPGYILFSWPIVNFGEMRLTPALSSGENANFVRDQKVIDWFSNEIGVKWVKSEQ